MFKIYGIPNCDTVKKARTFIEKKKVSSEFVDFKKYTPTLADIERWQKAFGGLPVNSKGVTYKKHKEHFETLSVKEQIKFIQENTSMIKRPVLEKDGKVLAFGFDENQYKAIFS
jgi:Spx/MgsR family transcriptional regulator